MLPHDLSPLTLSLEIALWATLTTAILATCAAKVFLEWPKKVRLILEIVILSPLVLPPTVIGYGLMLFLGRQGPLSYWNEIGILFTKSASIVAAVVVSFPLMYLSARAAFRSLDKHLTDASRSFGARTFRTFVSIELPLALQGLLAGVLLTFGRCLGEFGATLMVAGNIPEKTQTLPIALFFDVEAGDYPRAFVWTSFALVSSGLLIAAINFLSERNVSTR